MTLAINRSDDFNVDFDLQYRWYLHRAGEEVAERYFAAVIATLQELSRQPGLGRERKFRHPRLRGLHSFRLISPFDNHLVFYQFTDTELIVERVMHGMRNLPRRLREHPHSE